MQYSNQQLLYMYQDKLKQAQLLVGNESLSWRKEQLETDSDKIFDELRDRGFFFNLDNVGLLSAFQETSNMGV